MTSETHNHYITSLITFDYFKFASYVSKCLKIKIYTIYNLEWDVQGNISDMNQSNAIKKIIQFKFLEKYHSSQIFIETNKSVQQKKKWKTGLAEYLSSLYCYLLFCCFFSLLATKFFLTQI